MEPQQHQLVTLDIFLHHMEEMNGKLDAVILRGAEKDVEIAERLKALETNQAAAAWIATTLSAIVAAIVGGVVTMVKWGAR